MTTASRARDMMSRAFEAGATDFVSKPLDALEFVPRMKLGAVINDSGQREQMYSSAVAELSRLTDISFDERFDVKAGPALKGFWGLENELMRYADALYEMMMFSVQIDNALARSWDAFATGQPKVPTQSVRRIDGPPGWTGKATAAAMRSFQGRADLTEQAVPYEVDGLFEQLSFRISGGGLIGG
jgi:CheY-like chemotaxis protein